MSKKPVFLRTKDYMVTKETFDLLFDSEYDLLETSPAPSSKSLKKYYDSQYYISHTDSKKRLIDKAYNLVKKYTLKKKLSLICSLGYQEKKILDIGAGTGDFLKKCKDAGWIVKGIEPNDKARKKAREKNILLEPNLNNLRDCFDIITLWHVLEHIHNFKDFILKLKSNLNDKGTIIIAVPNFRSYDAQYYGEYWAAYDVPRHLWHFSKKAMYKIMKEQGCSIIDVLPMKFDSFYVSLLSEGNKTGKKNPIKAFYRGLLSNYKALKTKEYSSLIYVIRKNNL